MRRVAVLAVLASLALAGSAGAAGPPGSKSFTISLPTQGHGKIVEYVAHGKLKAGESVSGAIFQLTIGNLGNLPPYIRAAALERQTSPSTYEIFIGINAPKTFRRAAAASETADALDLIVASAVGEFPASDVDLDKGDGCEAFKIWHRSKDTNKESTYVTLGPWSTPPKGIFGYLVKDCS